MNRPSASLLAPGPLTLGVMILVAALTRVIPHPWNVSPVEAIALFGGAYFASRSLAIVIPLVALLLSDLVLAAINGGAYWEYFGSTSFVLVYTCIALSSVMAFAMRGKVNGARVLGFSLAGAVMFFLVSNFSAWVGSSMYPQTGAGLLMAYVAGIPFFKGTLFGTLFYSALLFGGFELLRRRVPALRVQTV